MTVTAVPLAVAQHRDRAAQVETRLIADLLLIGPSKPDAAPYRRTMQDLHTSASPLPFGVRGHPLTFQLARKSLSRSSC